MNFNYDWGAGHRIIENIGTEQFLGGRMRASRFWHNAVEMVHKDVVGKTQGLSVHTYIHA